KGIAEQVALARGVSPWRAANDLALAKGLVRELPRTLALLTGAAIGEQAAWNVARETVCLMPEDRAVVDDRLAGRLGGMSPKRAAATARAEAAKVDAESVVRRIRMAEADRCVTLRPAPDAMVYLSALLPVKDGVAAYAALSQHADTLKATGDEQSRGAIMADALLHRLTGYASSELIPVEVQLVMPATTLLASAAHARDGGGPSAHGRAADGEDDGLDGDLTGFWGEHSGQDAPSQTAGGECGWIGEHPIPAVIARDIALASGAEEAARWIRRLFTDPISGEITNADATRRRFTGATRRAIVARDRDCRGCGAPIRHLDHIQPHAHGGPTTIANGQGLCQRCNQVKEQPGWRTQPRIIEGRHVTVTTTPTGHAYVSTPPPPVAEPPPRRQVTSLEQHLRRRLAEHLGPRAG
ncbi:HNH endonuclease, partial [Cumulibacter manganitolerans]|uniref:HNH endonuclease n=1 Tax=Cumulibacter manganitolerans TaxID=1884992 RepID=UPI001296B1B4